jgi:hypothetical protein
VDTFPDPLLLRKSNPDLWICSQKLLILTVSLNNIFKKSLESAVYPILPDASKTSDSVVTFSAYITYAGNYSVTREGKFRSARFHYYRMAKY